MIKHPRSYEVSIWTLQDSFITVLKSSNLENKEQIQNGIVHLKDDGENNLSLSIPMYVNRDGVSIENPIWYNTRNGVISASMRKIKVIFNKKNKDERVFEFIITKVTEEHEGKRKTCTLDCEGLAYHELGKQGYRIELSADVYYAELEEWDKIYSLDPTEENAALKPINNINYWCDKVFKNSNWTYSICMDWSFEDGITDSSVSYMSMTQEERDELNAAREAAGLRRRDKIYKEPYVSSWRINSETGVLSPSERVEMEEKYVLIEEKESNRYNLVQAIAEAFQVFAKFVYKYDDNYHIIGREVIFYNNFIHESEGMVDFTYAYNTQHLTREMDGTDLVTKMYVKPLTDSGTLTGTINISSTSANPNREDYLINLDYMYMIGTITEEQYEEVKNYNSAIYQKNIAMLQLEKELTPLRTKLPEKQAILQTAKDAIPEDQELLNSAHEFLNSLTDQTGVIKKDEKSPQLFRAAPDGDSGRGYYFRPGLSGIRANTLKLYYDYDYTRHECKNEIQSYQLEFDKELGLDLTKVYGIPLPEDDDEVEKFSTTPIVYGTFEYEPDTVYRKKEEIYTSRLARDIKTRDDTQAEVDEIEAAIKEKEEQLEQLAKEKQEIVDRFERFMGPALREGTWQPEDEYADYQEHYNETLTLNSTQDNSKQLNMIWDTVPFDEEQENYYYSGVELNKVYYPCIRLDLATNVLAKLADDNFRESFCLKYKDVRYADPETAKAYKYLSIGTTTGCQFGFVRASNNNIIPVIFIVGAESMSDYEVLDDTGHVIDTYTILDQLKNNAQIGTLTINDDGTYSLTNAINIDSTMWMIAPENCVTVYPRFEINSDSFIDTDTSNMLYADGKQLEVNKDYYVLYRDEKWYLNIKPEAIFSAGTNWKRRNYLINYSNSTAALAIYLDAVQVLKENSTPKVSYSIEPLAIRQDFMYNAYDRLGQLARINDEELKFENVRGYVSEVELNLDKPWEDKYTIKNYKTKFEDLFSMIVAQTAQMKKNSIINGLAANLFTPTGALNNDLVNQALNNSSTLQNIINGNALIAAAQLAAAAASNKAILANSTVYKIMNGDVGLAFPPSDSIDEVILNRETGLVLQGHSTSQDEEETYPAFFKVTNGAMGFFKGTHTDQEHAEPFLYFEDGDFAVSGNIYAQNGWFGGDDGWIIGAGKLEKESGSESSKAKYYEPDENGGGSWKDLNSLGGLLYSANGKVVFAAGSTDTNPMFAFYKDSILNGAKTSTPILVFDGTNLSITGQINATSGSIGGWTIGDKYIGNAASLNESTVGMHVYNSGTATKVFWAGNYFNYNGENRPPFYVLSDGFLHAQNASITGSITATSFTLYGKDGSVHANVTWEDIEQGGSTIDSTVVEYVSSNQGTNPPDSTANWSITIPTVPAGNYLWTRTTVNYSQGNPSVSYTVSRQGETAKIETIYYLKTIAPTTKPTKPSSQITYDESSLDRWTKVVPDYSLVSNKDSAIYYYCQQYIWSDHYEASEAYQDYGLTTSNRTATEASDAAEKAAGAVGAFTVSGLHANYEWKTSEGGDGRTYNVALLSAGSDPNNPLSTGMLIGASGGITIVDVNNANGAAIAMKHGGIALRGATINLATTNNQNVIALSETGIALASNAGISLASGNIGLNGGNIGLDGGLISLTSGSTSLYMDTEGMTANTLFINNDFTAPGFRPYYTYKKRQVGDYEGLLQLKADLELNSYGRYEVEVTENASIINQQVAFNNIDVGYLHFYNYASDRIGGLPPLIFSYGRANVLFSMILFNCPLFTAVFAQGPGLNLNFQNCWIAHANYGIVLDLGANAKWMRDGTYTYDGKVTNDVFYLGQNTTMIVSGIIPKHDGYKAFGDLHFYFENGDVLETDGTYSIDPTDVTPSTTYTYGNELNSGRIVKRIYSGETKIETGVNPKSGRENNVVYTGLIGITSTAKDNNGNSISWPESYNSAKLILWADGTGAETTATLQVRYSTDTIDQFSTSSPIVNPEESFEINKKSLFEYNITSFLQNGAKTIILSENTTDDNPDLKEHTYYSENFRQIQKEQISIIFT